MNHGWREARLIPVSGIRGSAEQEVRAVSALLSVLTIVPSFAHAVLKQCGAPLGRVRANIETFIEVAFEDKKAKKSPRPDGLIRVTRGKQQWIALVEVKTGSNPLQKDQVEAYMDVASEQGFDAVITISNEIPPVLGSLPVALDQRKLKKTPVFHYSWARLISIAIMEKEVHGIEDPEQSWILSELIRYLEHQNSGALEFTDMGASWVPVLDAVRSGLVRKNDADVIDIAGKFDGLIRFLSLKLGQRLGVEVSPRLTRAETSNPEERTKNLAEELERDQTFSARIHIPGTVADLDISCDFRGRRITTSVTVPASGQSRNQTRVNWLLRPLDDNLTNVVIEAFGARRSHAASIEEFREDIRDVLPEGFPDISRFSISQIHPMGTQKTTSGRSSFITSLGEAIDKFYIDILQKQRTWTPPAPTYKETSSAPNEEPALSSAEIKAGEEPPQD